MTEQPVTPPWSQVLLTTLGLLIITSVGCAAAFALWLKDLYAPQVMILGSGNQLSLLVVDGPARLLLATGDDAIGFENALASIRPIFARRIDVLLMNGAGDSLLVPYAADRDPHTRASTGLGPLTSRPQNDKVLQIPEHDETSQYRLGTSVTVTVETRYPFGADPAIDPPHWRATIEHGNTNVIVISDGAAASLFPPVNSVSALVVSGADPTAAWSNFPAPALVANADATTGPDLRSAFEGSRTSPDWAYRVGPGEALRVRFAANGLQVPSDSAFQPD